MNIQLDPIKLREVGQIFRNWGYSLSDEAWDLLEGHLKHLALGDLAWLSAQIEDLVRQALTSSGKRLTIFGPTWETMGEARVILLRLRTTEQAFAELSLVPTTVSHAQEHLSFGLLLNLSLTDQSTQLAEKALRVCKNRDVIVDKEVLSGGTAHEQVLRSCLRANLRQTRVQYRERDWDVLHSMLQKIDADIEGDKQHWEEFFNLALLEPIPSANTQKQLIKKAAQRLCAPTQEKLSAKNQPNRDNVGVRSAKLLPSSGRAFLLGVDLRNRAYPYFVKTTLAGADEIAHAVFWDRAKELVKSHVTVRLELIVALHREFELPSFSLRATQVAGRFSVSISAEKRSTLSTIISRYLPRFFFTEELWEQRQASYRVRDNGEKESVELADQTGRRLDFSAQLADDDGHFVLVGGRGGLMQPFPHFVEALISAGDFQSLAQGLLTQAQELSYYHLRLTVFDEHAPHRVCQLDIHTRH